MKARYTHTQEVNIRTGVNGGLTFTVRHDFEHSAPMGVTAREDAYYRQNGPRPITRRQERQLIRMERRNIVAHQNRRAKAVV